MLVNPIQHYKTLPSSRDKNFRNESANNFSQNTTQSLGWKKVLIYPNFSKLSLHILNCLSKFDRA